MFDVYGPVTEHPECFHSAQLYSAPQSKRCRSSPTHSSFLLTTLFKSSSPSSSQPLCCSPPLGAPQIVAVLIPVKPETLPRLLCGVRSSASPWLLEGSHPPWQEQKAILKQSVSDRARATGTIRSARENPTLLRLDADSEFLLS